MNRRLVLTVLLALLGLAALPAGAFAGWFPAGVNPPVDGPSADIVKLGGVDLARDGTGGIVYIKRDGGVPHVFLSRFNGGQFRAPERVDNGIVEPASDVVIAATDADRLAIVWTAANKVFANIVVGNDQAPGPLLGPAELYAAPGPVTAPAVDMGINGTAYASWTAPGGGGTDVLRQPAVRSHVDVDRQPDGHQPGQRRGRRQPALARRRVGRGQRDRGLGRGHERLRPARHRPQPVGRPAADLGPRHRRRPRRSGAIRPTSTSRTTARSCGRCSARTSAAPRARSRGGCSARPSIRRSCSTTGARTAPRVAMNGRGQGMAAFESAGGGVSGNPLYLDAFAPPGGLSGFASAAGTEPKPGASEHRENVVAWRFADGAGNASIKGRLQPEPGKPFDPEVELSRPDLGAVPAGEFAVSGDRLAGFAVAMAQGPATSRAITVALHDRLPGRPGAIARSSWQSGRRAKLEWRPGRDLWGPQRFRVVVGGRVVGETTGTSLVPTQRLAAGRPIKYQVIAIDMRGQQAPSRTRRVRFDNDAPRFKVRIVGKRRAGRALRVIVRPKDKGSGVREVRVRYGDGTRVVKQRKRFGGRHAYRRGRHTLKVTVYDVAGNRRIQKVKLRIT